MTTKTERNEEIFNLYAIQDIPQTEIAKRFDITPTRVSQICRTQRVKELSSRLSEDLAEARWVYQRELRSVIEDAELRYRGEIQSAIVRYERGVVYGKPKIGVVKDYE